MMKIQFQSKSRGFSISGCCNDNTYLYIQRNTIFVKDGFNIVISNILQRHPATHLTKTAKSQFQSKASPNPSFLSSHPTSPSSEIMLSVPLSQSPSPSRICSPTPPFPALASSPSHSDIAPSSQCTFVPCQESSHQMDDGQVLYPEQEVLHEVDGFFIIDEEENNDENTSIYSEESFVLRLDSCSDQEGEDDLNVCGELEQDDQHDFDGSSSDEEVLAEATDLFLSVSERIQILLLLATMKRHNLTYSAAEDMMELTGVLTESEVFLPPRYLIKRAIEEYSCCITGHHICPACGKYNGVKTTKTFNCVTCRETVSTELEALLRNPSVDILNPHEREKIVQSNYEDIYDGNYYRKNVVENTLTINFFVDGLQIATTSKKSAWPVLACLNELPLPIRRKHIFLISLWLGLKKPNCNEYLEPFVTECVRLEATGLSFVKNGTTFIFKFKVIVGISDTIARPLLRNSTQFNGWYGCGLCLHPGFRMKHNKGHIRSYSTFVKEYPKRSHDQLMQMAREAEQVGKPVKGIKGVSVLSKLQDFNMVQGLDLDFFHALVNVCKRFANLWFLEKFKNKPFGLSSKFAEINARLLQITPTSDVSRNPRSLKDRSDYRGHEWFHWVVEYSMPVLKGILPARYLNHWSLLVHAVALIMQNSVAKSELAYAGRYLSRFVSEIDVLYGKHNVTFSAHLLTHLEHSISEYGQPWAHSAFIFESFLAEIKQAVKSSNGASLQICKAMQRKIAIRKLEEDMEESMTNSHKQYLNSMLHRKNLAPAYLKVGAACLLGKPKSGALSLDSVSSLRRAGVQCQENSSFFSFDRCQMFNVVYHSEHYSRVSKQNNSVVLLVSNEVFVIHSFVVFNNECFVLGNIIEENRQQKLCDIPLPHIRILKDEPEEIRRCFPVCDIDSKLLSFNIKSVTGESLRIACINVLKMEMLR
ncbi:Neural cell adhesion molecule 1 [Frankliniella fusca]|uniref:Neural cell adhesion molecule 1 n=1 Tax=Frankliniella fusca TaxID=407009 RepID=A0AAE1L9M4_9NEOP|nr:Neural cell adhesion molecule 1 [Frankliniella fusca]